MQYHATQVDTAVSTAHAVVVQTRNFPAGCSRSGYGALVAQ